MRDCQETTLETPITTMIDIVFLLIIFFVITSSIMPEEADGAIRLPSAEFAASGATPPNALILNLHRDGRILLNQKEITCKELPVLLQAGRPLLIRCDAQIPYRTLQPILETASRKGIPRARLSVLPENAP